MGHVRDFYFSIRPGTTAESCSLIELIFESRAINRPSNNIRDNSIARAYRHVNQQLALKNRIVWTWTWPIAVTVAFFPHETNPVQVCNHALLACFSSINSSQCWNDLNLNGTQNVHCIWLIHWPWIGPAAGGQHASSPQRIMWGCSISGIPHVTSQTSAWVAVVGYGWRPIRTQPSNQVTFTDQSLSVSKKWATSLFLFSMAGC